MVLATLISFFLSVSDSPIAQQGGGGTSPTISELLSSPVFWFSTVIVGVIVGIIGNLATQGMQRLWARFSIEQKRKLEEQSKEFEEQVQLLLANPASVTDLRIKRIHALLRTTITLLFLLIMGNASFALPFFLGEGLPTLVNLLVSVGAVSTILSEINADRYARKLLVEHERRLEKGTTTDTA